MIRWIKEYKVMMISSLITLLLGFVILYFVIPKKSVKILDYENVYYSFQYDSSWKVEESKEESTKLINGDSTIFVLYLSLDDNYRYKNLEEMKSQILRDIGRQNVDYYLLAEQYLQISKNNYEGYKALYECDDIQVSVIILKDNEKLVIITYEADSQYFDILLDSVEAILESFALKEKIYSITSELNIHTETIPWKKNEALMAKVKESIVYELANENYLVQYELPSNFQLTNMDSSSSTYRYLDLDVKEDITVRMNIYNSNIYSYLNGSTFASLYKIYKEDSESNFKEYLEEASWNGYNCYIYKNNYVQHDYQYETVNLIIELNKNHILIVSIDSRNIEIPKELIEKIKISSVTNYASYTNTIKNEQTQQSTLKIFTDNDYKKIESIILTIPNKWEEIVSTKSYNIYKNRGYGLDYLTDLDYYQYSVVYDYSRAYYDTFDKELTSKIELANSSISSRFSYGQYEKINFKKNIILNNREWVCYGGGYTDVTGRYIDISLLYTKTDNGLLEVKLLGDGVKVPESFFEEVTNFDVKLEE